MEGMYAFRVQEVRMGIDADSDVRHPWRCEPHSGRVAGFGEGGGQVPYPCTMRISVGFVFDVAVNVRKNAGNESRAGGTAGFRGMAVSELQGESRL